MGSRLDHQTSSTHVPASIEVKRALIARSCRSGVYVWRGVKIATLGTEAVGDAVTREGTEHLFSFELGAQNRCACKRVAMNPGLMFNSAAR